MEPLDMKSLNSALVLSRSAFVSRALALICICALLGSTFSPSLSAQQRTASQKGGLTEDQRILHVLNRLGFGARPGDVERVKAMGLDNYINQQLNPDKINDAVADAKVKNLPTLSMS